MSDIQLFRLKAGAATELDILKTETERAIALHKEHSIALIAAATGQIDVRQA